VCKGTQRVQEGERGEETERDRVKGQKDCVRGQEKETVCLRKREKQWKGQREWKNARVVKGTQRAQEEESGEETGSVEGRERKSGRDKESGRVRECRVSGRGIVGECQRGGVSRRGIVGEKVEELERVEGAKRMGEPESEEVWKRERESGNE